MTWKTPRTLWATGEIPGASDFSRIEGNIDYLYSTYFRRDGGTIAGKTLITSSVDGILGLKQTDAGVNPGVAEGGWNYIEFFDAQHDRQAIVGLSSGGDFKIDSYIDGAKLLFGSNTVLHDGSHHTYEPLPLDGSKDMTGDLRMIGPRIIRGGSATDWFKIEAQNKLYFNYDNPTIPVQVGKFGQSLDMSVFGNLDVKIPHESNSSSNLTLGSLYQGNLYGIGFYYGLDENGLPYQGIGRYQGGTQYKTISIGSDKVGINKTTPDEALHVGGNGRFDGDIIANSIQVATYSTKIGKSNVSKLVNGNSSEVIEISVGSQYLKGKATIHGSGRGIFVMFDNQSSPQMIVGYDAVQGGSAWSWYEAGGVTYGDMGKGVTGNAYIRIDDIGIQNGNLTISLYNESSSDYSANFTIFWEVW